MKIMVVNPNSTQSMTAKIGICARSIAAPGTKIVAVNPSDSPLSIEGHGDGAMAIPGLLAEIRKGEAEGFDGYVIACFDDPGLDACREVAVGPVVGICEAAMHAASMIATGFSVVTTLSRSIPIIEELAEKYGMHRKCRRVRASEVPVLALEDEGNEAREKIRDEILRAIAEDRCEAVLLGCAGMADLTDWLSDETGIPVIDGVVCAVKMVEALVGAGLATSKVGGYAAPRVK
ncbi:MAG: aspartate/glutamate racemase family protein [Proteobacteria bacterium]|nr:aspartate/glutamate racemase family protein [Pseudomonadota bacterium]